MARRVSKSQALGDTLAAPYPPATPLIWALLCWCTTREEWLTLVPENVPVTTEALVAAFLLTRGSARELVCDIINSERGKTPWYRAVNATLRALRDAGLVTW